VIFRQLVDRVSDTFTYLLADRRTRQAVLIDPVFEMHARDVALLRELELSLVATLDTHCHADHVTGAWLMKQALGSRTGLAPEYAAKNVDLPLAHGDAVRFGDHALEVRATPGHTEGCRSFVLGGAGMVFTGDALLVRGTGRTDFQKGDAHQLYRSIHQQLFTLPEECVVYPAHDYEGRTASTIGEERRFNQRIGGGAREEDFVGSMLNLGLPHPKQIDVAVPANLRAGQPEDGKVPCVATWGPVLRTYGGVFEIGPEWVAMHRGEVRLLDVRDPQELAGELGTLQGAQNVPLGELRSRAAEVTGDKPVVVVCQTGRRSALAATILTKAGLRSVASLTGGMVRWRELGLPS
jgi:glyoxylase-like metal-dependent hydrolase (beta-lactamase superfamily II)/rhodanese-related sulfurtransferase